MGDRRQVIILFDAKNPEFVDQRNEDFPVPGAKTGNIVVLYTHWGGSDLVKDVAAILDSPVCRDRWTDDSYFTRILIQHLIGDDKGSTGYGIAPCLTESEYQDVIIDVDNQQIWLWGTDGYQLQQNSGEPEKRSFQEFIDWVNEGGDDESDGDDEGEESDEE